MLLQDLINTPILTMSKNIFYRKSFYIHYNLIFYKEKKERKERNTLMTRSDHMDTPKKDANSFKKEQFEVTIETKK